MVSLIVQQESFEYLVYEEKSPQNIIFSATRHQNFFYRDSTEVFDSAGRLCFSIKHPRYFECPQYKIFDSNSELWGNIKVSFNNSKTLIVNNGLVYQIKLAGYFSKVPPQLIKNNEIIGTYHTVKSTYRDSDFKFEGTNLGDLKNIIIAFLATDKWDLV